MGKRSKKRNDEQVEIETGSKKKQMSKSEKPVSNEIISDSKRKNKIKYTVDPNQIEINDSSVKIKKKRKNISSSVPSENLDLISNNLKPRSNTSGKKLKVEGIANNKQKRKKRDTEIGEHSFEKSTIIPNKKNKSKEMQETISKEVNSDERPFQGTLSIKSKIMKKKKKRKIVEQETIDYEKVDNNDEEPVLETLNKNSEIIKKKKKNTPHEEQQHLEQNTHNGNKEPSKKKKKRKVVEQETVDDEEVDNNDEEPVLETLSINSQIIKKKKKNTSHVDEQHFEQNTLNGNKEAPKKKKKREVVEQETVDDEEIDKFCDELDEFHNQQYENWVKLIEKSLSKK